MRPVDLAFYSYALRVSRGSRGSGVFYSDDRRDAEEFGEHGVSKNTICESRGRLEDHGWFVRIGKGRRRKRNSLTGSWKPLLYRVLTHAEWTAKHPGKCRFPNPTPVAESSSDEESPVPNSGTGPVPNSGTGETAPFPNSDSTGPNFWVAPVPNSGTKTEVKKDLKGKKKKDHQSDDTDDSTQTCSLMEQAKEILMQGRPENERPYVQCGLEIIAARV